MIARLYHRLWTCRRIGHSPGFYRDRPYCVRCEGILPGVWTRE